MITPLPELLDLETALSAMGDDREIYEEVLETYLQSTPLLIGDLEAAMRTHDRSAIKRCAHTIKSSSLTVGGMRLGAAAAALERVAEEASAPEIERHAAGLRIRFAELTAALVKEGFAAA